MTVIVTDVGIEEKRIRSTSNVSGPRYCCVHWEFYCLLNKHCKLPKLANCSLLWKMEKLEVLIL